MPSQLIFPRPGLMIKNRLFLLTASTIMAQATLFLLLRPTRTQGPIWTNSSPK